MASKAVDSPQTRKVHLVFLDTRQDVLDSLAPALEQKGYCALAARGPEEALQFCKEYRPRVLLPDVTEPRRTHELLEFISLFKDPTLGNIGIVLLTKNSAPECDELRGIRYVREPYLMEDILCAIKEVEEIVHLREERDMFLEQLTEYAEGLEKMVREQTAELVAANERLRHLSMTDDLTGVRNRRYFFERLEQEINQTMRYGHSLSVMILDLDNFKSVNDRMGHLAGDAVLREFASLLKNKLRKGETVARYGGEEFAVILPHVVGPDALKAAEAVRKRVEVSEFSCSAHGIALTASIGVAELDADIKDPDEVLGRADRALYEAKRTGKNRACLWPAGERR